MIGGDYMSVVKNFYMVLVNGESVFRGSFGAVESVYHAIIECLQIIGREDVTVNIAICLDRR